MTGMVTSCLRLPYPPYGQDLSELTVFCDFDGPIMDVSERYYSAYQLGLAETQATYQSQGTSLPLQVLSQAAFWQMKQNRVPDPEIAQQSGLRQEQIQVFLQQVGRIVNQPALAQQDQIQPGVRWALTWLHARKARLVLVTLRCQAQVVQILRESGLEDFFTDVWGTQDDQAAYQNYAEVKTQLLQHALAELAFPDSKLSSAWMIGDTEADILAGQALGIPTLALTCGIRSRQYLQQFTPTFILDDLAAAADYLTYAWTNPLRRSQPAL
jgi:phosphoglycolate phosphatase